MSFGNSDLISNDSEDIMNEINMTPMVDIMLVLLIIFIITVPVMKHSVNIDLPRATNEVQRNLPETLRLSVDAQGLYFINEVQTGDSELVSLFKSAAARSPQPELHIQGDKAVRYERVAQAMAAAQQAGLKKIGFITEPVP
jgi:biopolymer transport protein ExbD